jgi:hypothetical protein
LRRAQADGEIAATIGANFRVVTDPCIVSAANARMRGVGRYRSYARAFTERKANFLLCAGAAHKPPRSDRKSQRSFLGIWRAGQNKTANTYVIEIPL